MVIRLAPMLALLAVALPTGAAAGTGTAPGCDDILPAAQPAGEMRPLAEEDLVRLRDIGPVDPFPHAAPFFTLSPTGDRVAFQLRRADPGRNLYCLAMAVVDLGAPSPPRIVDQGGDLQLLTIDIRGTADFPTGIAAVVTPRWSPDGRWIAFLRRDAGTTQVWRAMADGSGSAALTHSPDDVVDFRIGGDGATIVYATRPGLRRARDAIEREGLTGLHYDDRFSPVAGNRPFPVPPIAREVRIFDLASGRDRDAGAPERALLAEASDLISTAGAPAQGEPGARVSIAATSLTGGARAGSMSVRLADGSSATCNAPECEGATEPWMPDDRRIYFYRREGWARASTAIYEWLPASGSVRRLMVTEDVLADCAPTGETLLCLRESSLQPRRLERLDPRTGARQLLFDPNPAFSRLALGRVERLHWRNSFGLEALGDLVLPTGYRAGRTYPLVVVQYDTRGFLRGGTGDDYPIQAFANRGFAILSVRSPAAIGMVRGAADFHEGRRLNLAGFAERRSLLDSVETGVRMIVRRGIADPARIGITGLSDGASTATFALLHSPLFSAVAMSSCCIDTTLAMRIGPAAARDFQSVGYPGLLGRNDPFWREISLSVNAPRIATPILLQLSDDEYLSALESYTALREAGAPVDMFVFPNEHHAKWQPAHRLAVYRRSVDWFDYWLRGQRSRSPDRQAELLHWDSLRPAPAPPATP
jgi:dipeptidyl aminopeptidase/acylaminoacyl peptidase